MGEVSVSDPEPMWDLSIRQHSDVTLQQVILAKEKGSNGAPSEWATCPQLKSYVSFWEKLQLCRGVLAFVEGNVARAVVPQSMVPVELRSLHNNKTGGHLGAEKLIDRVQTRFSGLGGLKV